MLKVKLSTMTPEWPLLRQTPDSKGIWNGCQFYVDQDIEDCDYWVVYEGVLKTERTFCPLENIILITAEPFSGHYPQKFLAQFKRVVTFHRDIKHPNVIYSQPGLPWHVGRRVINGKNISFTKDYNELKAIKHFEKDKLIAVISSDKTFYSGHVKRLKFVKKIAKQKRFDIDIFGRGINEIEDKWDAIARYKYNIAIENSTYPDYFTEKLTDVFLGGSYPFYYGCTNIFDYFPEGSLTVIDINNFDEAIEIIDSAIKNKLYEKSIEKIQAARDLVLDKYNIFPLITNIINSTHPSKNKDRKLVKIEPARRFLSLSTRVINKIEVNVNRLRAIL
ncbi:MAG: glycosyltransferase family 10 [Candidatus Bathyarchaeia archaeon]